MQTFVPFADFARSAAALDRARLGKQRVETLQVMRALTIPDYGWRHHPVVAMWRGYRPALMVYQDAFVDEWVSRGFADTTRASTLATLDEVADDAAVYRSGAVPLPPWLGREEVHRSHRSNLVRKDAEHYRSQGFTEPDDLPYVWPAVE
ncbi:MULTISPECIES: MSMEG_6728 family protein [unclassified Microbacterium]|uniref:MSMEG_6728 family protein n=1 Tax=unclassified Microbacterium TaxID=2609290 RepID=UPI0038673D71